MKKRTAVALGQAFSSKPSALAVPRDRLGDAEKIKALESQVEYMQAVIAQLKAKASGTSPNAHTPPSEAVELNKDGVPVGIICHGTTSKSYFLQFLEVLQDGYVVGATKYESLSAAAEAVSGVRRSGWVFWKLSNGITLKEAFKGH